MIRSPPTTVTKDMMAQEIMVNSKAVTSISLALRLSFWPLLLATSAETAMLVEKNSARAKNFGCVVRPTAATA